MTQSRTSLRVAGWIGLLAMLGAGGAGIALTTACMPTPRSVQDLTYPPDFAYIPPERLRSSMWILASEVHQLDELLGQTPDADDLVTQEAVRRSLQRMSVAIEQIDHPGRASQHPVINIHLRRFAERLALAQKGVDRSPPNYFQATALSGSCFLCHSSGDGS